MTKTTAPSVNPMVAKKLRHNVAPNLEVVATMLKDGLVPMIKTDALAPKSEQHAAKFSDLFHYKNFITSNKLGTVEIKVSGSSKDPLIQRVTEEYLSKNLTPNCSITQVFEAGGKISVTTHLTPEAKEIIAKVDGEPKPKRTRAVKTVKAAKPKAAAKPKTAKKAKAPAKRTRKAAAPKAEKAAPAKRTRKAAAKEGGTTRTRKAKGAEASAAAPPAASGVSTAVEVNSTAAATPGKGPEVQADWGNGNS